LGDDLAVRWTDVLADGRLQEFWQIVLPNRFGKSFCLIVLKNRSGVIKLFLTIKKIMKLLV